MWIEKQLKANKTRKFMQINILLANKFYKISSQYFKVRKRAKIRNRYNQAPHLTQDINGNVHFNNAQNNLAHFFSPETALDDSSMEN